MEMAIIASIFLLSFIVLAHEFGHFLAAKFSGVRVEEFGLGYPPRALAKKLGETLYSLNIIPFGGFVRISEEPGDPKALYYQPFWRKALVMLGGVVLNLIVGLALFALVIGFLGVIKAEPVVEIKEVIENSPAAEVGLEVGDQIAGYAENLEAEFWTIEDGENFVEFIQRHQGREIFLLVRKKESIGSQTYPVASPQQLATPIAIAPKDIFGENKVMLGIGFSVIPVVYYQPVSLLQVPGEILREAKNLVFGTFENLKRATHELLVEKVAPENLAGPVGIYMMSTRVAEFGFWPLLHFGGTLSLGLALSNLLPIPALDGGKLLLLLAERIKGERIDPRMQAAIQGIGIALVVLLMILVTFQDIKRWF